MFANRERLFRNLKKMLEQPRETHDSSTGEEMTGSIPHTI